MNSSTLKSDGTSGILMSRTMLAVLVTVLGFEVTVLLLGGFIEGHWKGVKWMAIFGAGWVADLLLGRFFITRRPDVVAARSRYGLVVLAFAFALLAVEQIESWAGP